MKILSYTQKKKKKYYFQAEEVIRRRLMVFLTKLLNTAANTHPIKATRTGQVGPAGDLQG